jgi:mannose-6-phosphate isomerase-like protein (cupin superfamily)
MGGLILVPGRDSLTGISGKAAKGAHMQSRRTMQVRVMVGAGVVVLALAAQQGGPKPTCKQCPATYIPVSELNAYTAKAVKYGIVDQQVRSIDIGKAQVGIGMVTRGKLLPGAVRKGAVAEHEQVSEVYHVIDGEATLLTGPDLVNPVKRPDDEKTVRLQNGPGYNADSIRGPMTTHLKPGDMIVIPAGTGHLFTEIPDHITYMMVRIDPDKIVPTKSQAESEADLKTVPEPRKQ